MSENELVFDTSSILGMELFISIAARKAENPRRVSSDDALGDSAQERFPVRPYGHNRLKGMFPKVGNALRVPRTAARVTTVEGVVPFW